MTESISYRVIGCAMNVHNELGSGFQELIYQRALAREFDLERIPYEREKDQEILYKGLSIGTRRADFIVDGSLLVELKAINQLESVHLVQIKNYLAAYGFAEGLLINFGQKKLDYKKIFRNR